MNKEKSSMNQEKKLSPISIFLTITLALLLLKTTIVTYKFVQRNYRLSEHKNELEKVNLLLKYGYTQEINKKDSNGETPLWWACYNNDFELAKYLIEHWAQNSVNLADDYGDTPLWWACFRNNLQLAQYLLDYGAQQTINNIGDYGYTPVAWACKNNYTQMVKLLIQNGAITDKQDNFDWLPIYSACCNGNLKIVKYLVKNNTINSLNKSYTSQICTSINTGVKIYTPHYSKNLTQKFFASLYYACWTDNIELINFILFGPQFKFVTQNFVAQSQEVPNSETKPLLPSIYFAALAHNTQIIKYLIENYAD